MSATTHNAQFKEMLEATPSDWKIILDNHKVFCSRLSDRIISHLELLSADNGGFPVSRLEHCLQTATRAYQDGCDEEYVVCALLHDVGDTLGSYNHPDVAAAILKPFVSEANLWMVAHHGEFQGYYFFDHIGLDKDTREQHRGHPHFTRTEEFCRKYDQAAFDPGYASAPLTFFKPMIARLFSAPKNSLYLDALLQPTEQTPLDR